MTEEILKIKKSSNSNKERGIRWFVTWDLKKRLKKTAILCQCNKLVTIRPKTDGSLKFAHACGFAANIILEDYAI